MARVVVSLFDKQCLCVARVVVSLFDKQCLCVARVVISLIVHAYRDSVVGLDVLHVAIFASARNSFM